MRRIQVLQAGARIMGEACRKVGSEGLQRSARVVRMCLEHNQPRPLIIASYLFKCCPMDPRDVKQVGNSLHALVVHQC